MLYYSIAISLMYLISTSLIYIKISKNQTVNILGTTLGIIIGQTIGFGFWYLVIKIVLVDLIIANLLPLAPILFLPLLTWIFIISITHFLYTILWGINK